MSEAQQEARFVQLDTQAVHLSDHLIGRFGAVIPRGHTVEDCLQPHYWAHHSRRFKAARTLITAIWEDNSRIAEFFVANCGSNFAAVRLVSSANFDADPVKADATYMIEWISAQEKHGVLRVGDRALIKTGFYSKKDAEKYIVDELK